MKLLPDYQAALAAELDRLLEDAAANCAWAIHHDRARLLERLLAADPVAA